MELSFTEGVHERFAETIERSLAYYVIKAPIVLGLDVDISVAEEEMLLEVSDGVELMVAEVAGVVILEFQLKLLRSVWSTLLHVAVKLPFGRKSLLASFTSHIASPVEHVAAYVLLLNDLCEVGV